MGQTLTHGVYLPDEGERNCYNGLAGNWTILDGAVGTIAEHTSALAGKAPLVHTHTKSDITDFPAYGTTAGTICEGNDSRLSDARTPVAHTHGKADVTDLFNSANTWTGDNTFSKAVGFTKVNATTLYAQNSRVELGDSVLSGNSYNQISFWDKNGDNLSYLRQTYTTDGTNAFDLFIRNKFLNGVPNTAGTVDYAYFGLKINADKSKEAVFKANLRPYDSTYNYNLGDSTYQWNNLYAKNYYYNGVAWGLDKANTWSAQQKIVGNNSRGTVSIYNPAYTKGSALSSTELSIGSIYMGDSGQTGLANSLSFISTDLASNGARTLLSLSAMENTASSGTRTNVTILYDKNDAENPRKVIIQGSVLPHPSVPFSLGTSTNKWKTLNGINPGALSLPDLSVSVVVDTTDWIYDGLTANLIKFNNAVQTFSGWLYITAQNTSASDRIVVRYIGSDASNLTFISGKFDGASSIFVACPIVAGVSTYVWSTKALNTIKIYKALGNV